MNKIMMVVGVAIIVVLGIWVYRDVQNSDGGKIIEQEDRLEERDRMEQKAASETGTMMKKEEGAMMAQGGQYVAYDASKIAFAKEGKVVLFFRASWCPSCRALDADIKANLGQIPENVLILDVDYDKYKDLKREYGVTYQHTLVQVDENGKMIAKWSGSPELRDLLQEVK